MTSWESAYSWLAEEPLELFHTMASVMAGMGAVAFVCLTFLQLKAPYGRYSTGASSWWGFGMNAKLAWFIQELPCFIFAALAVYQKATGSSDSSVAGWVLLGLYTFHYTNRALVYPWLLKDGAETRLAPFLLALLFCTYNGYMQCRYLVLFDTYGPEGHLSLPFLCGAVLFMAGMYINWSADATLRSLRTPANPEFSPNIRYYIPRGGAFEFVTGANFFGEIMEWAGFALAAGSWVATAFALFTFCNIGPRGAAHHENMKKKFADYPTGRKGVIPFLW